MRFTFRWYGEKDDQISLQQIGQIPGMDGIVGALFDIPVGEVWPLEPLREIKRQAEKNNLYFKDIESINVHEDIKLGLPGRDKYIENYILSLRNAAKAGVEVVCYNFMPVFDWTRTDLAKPLYDGSTALAYDYHLIAGKKPQDMAKEILDNSNGFVLPGWEPERLAQLTELFNQYDGMDEDDLRDNLKYFLQAVVPEAENCGIKMAIHPDDPPISVFGLPRIVKNEKDLDKIAAMVDSESNGFTICTGSLGSNLKNDIPHIIRKFGRQKRIAFMHVRNIQVHEPWVFNEVAHKSKHGSLDIFEIMKAIYDIDFDGPIRPDHGRMIWDEKGRPGYGLFDRALGVNYLCGLWDAINRICGRK
ncbi:mannonate dehydratase [Pectinatus haikarae]|uniref:mannonate dehydratase n=1 Tax=Pectinatus haikarae TaxID=349096 RepID=UPI0018C464DA|nr:mannonate dehydratase [Pectinatus haikarae]